MVGSIDQVTGAHSEVGNFVPPLIQPRSGGRGIERKRIVFDVLRQQDRISAFIRSSRSAGRLWSAFDPGPILKLEVTGLLLHRVGVFGYPGVRTCLRHVTLRWRALRLH